MQMCFAILEREKKMSQGGKKESTTANGTNPKPSCHFITSFAAFANVRLCPLGQQETATIWIPPPMLSGLLLACYIKQGWVPLALQFIHDAADMS